MRQPHEWNFSDVNPPVTPWAALDVYEREAEIRGEGDRQFLARVFTRLLASHDPRYLEMALKVNVHFRWIAVNLPAATRRCGTRRTASTTT
jgi:hypothetical protein